MSKKEKLSDNGKKQQLSTGSKGERVEKVHTDKSKREELADKSEGFGGSDEELDDANEARKYNTD